MKTLINMICKTKCLRAPVIWSGLATAFAATIPLSLPADEPSSKASIETTEFTQPGVLRRRDPSDPADPGDPAAPSAQLGEPLYPLDPIDDQALGYVGQEQPRPAEMIGSDFFPIDDRYRLGFPQWDRYWRGGINRPYDSSVLKGDFPILGNDIFFEFTGFSDTFYEKRQVPVAGGDKHQRFTQQTFFLTFDIFEDDNTFDPADWFLSFTPAFRLRNTVNDDNGTDQDIALQEGFIDIQLCEYDPYFDLTNFRFGRQAFQSDFRGFVFADVNDAARLFGTAQANRIQWNLIAFDLVQKDAGSALNTMDDREQYVFIANYFYEDFPCPGFNVEMAAHYNADRFKNDVDAVWLEFAADGNLGRYDVSAALIQALGRDDNNPVAGRSVDISAQLAAFEIARPCDWITPKFSIMWASGDGDPTDGTAKGFDAIFDNPLFAGDGFTFLNREAINIGGVQLSNTFSFLPNLRAKAAAPSNFVNPGLILINTGFDAVLTTRTFLTANLNYYQLVHTDPVEQLAGRDIGSTLGLEGSIGVVYKPHIIDNVQFTFGAAVMDPGNAIEDLAGASVDTLFTTFTAVTLIY